MRLFRRTVLGGLVFVIVGTAVGVVVLRRYGFSARAEPTALEAFVARRLRRLATPPAVRELRNPLDPTPLAIAEARDHFADHCALCHANDGSGNTAINQGLYPRAPDLRAEWTQGLTDGELFAIIRDGIRFTGMPGWGGDNEANWKLVLFIRHLPRLTAFELELMEEVRAR